MRTHWCWTAVDHSSYSEAPASVVMALGSGAFGRWFVLGEVPMVEFVSLWEDEGTRTLSVCHVKIYRPESGVLLGTKSASMWSLDFPASRLWEISLWCLSHLAWCFCYRSLDWDTGPNLSHLYLILNNSATVAASFYREAHKGSETWNAKVVMFKKAQKLLLQTSAETHYPHPIPHWVLPT